MFVAIVNNNLIAYDQARDLASVIDAAIKANDPRADGDDDGSENGGENGENGKQNGEERQGQHRRMAAARGRVSLDSEDGQLLTETAIHLEMEEACRYVVLSL